MGVSVLSFAVVGACLALSAWHFMRAVSTDVRGFDRETIEDYGILFSLVIFLFTGPVLALETLWTFERRWTFVHRFLGLMLFLTWSAALGMTAIALGMRLLP